MGWNYRYDIFSENSGRVTYAQNLYDASLNRSYDYDHVGRLWVSHNGNEADGHAGLAPWPSQPSGAYSQQYAYDQWGNLTSRLGWGGQNASDSASYTNNRRDGISYDLAGNLVNDGGQYSYDATGQQVNATYPPSWNGYTLQQGYDGDRLRVQKTDNGVPTYYLRSSVLGGQVVAEIKYNPSWGWYWDRGYVYLGSQLLAVQQGGVTWMHSDPVTKSQRGTDIYGNNVPTATVDTDPWGGETSKSNSAFQPHKFTSYERDGNGNDQAMMRQYHGYFSRFDQPDPYDGSYDLGNPQTLNRYAYTGNDPVNFADPSGTEQVCFGGSVTVLTITTWDVSGAQPRVTNVSYQVLRVNRGVCVEFGFTSETSGGGGGSQSRPIYGPVPLTPAQKAAQERREKEEKASQCLRNEEERIGRETADEAQQMRNRNLRDIIVGGSTGAALGNAPGAIVGLLMGTITSHDRTADFTAKVRQMKQDAYDKCRAEQGLPSIRLIYPLRM
jgi:RHS repeat-associated protein